MGDAWPDPDHANGINAHRAAAKETARANRVNPGRTTYAMTPSEAIARGLKQRLQGRFIAFVLSPSETVSNGFEEGDRRDVGLFLRGVSVVGPQTLALRWHS